jgi:hypothetical protein
MKTTLSRAALIVILSAGGLARAKTVSYGIAIGNNAPPVANAGAAAPLHYADDDAVRYFQLFRRLGSAYLLTSLDADTQRRYPEASALAEPPTLRAFLARTSELAERMRADRLRGDDPVLYIAFSGHGGELNGEAFLAFLDGALTRKMLYEQVLTQLQGTYVHLIVDACNADAVVGARGEPKERGAPRDIDAHIEEVSPAELRTFAEKRTLARFPFVGALVSSTAGEQAHEWSRLESGVFSHEVLSGLWGAADINGDGKVEYSEVQAFVSAANRQLRDPRALPKIVAWSPSYNRSAPLVNLRALKDVTPLRGSFSALGRFYIELENGERYIDAHLGDAAERELLLPSRTVAYIVTDGGEAELHPAGSPLALASLHFGKRREAERGAVDTAYRVGLFAEPFTATYYRGFVDSANLPTVTFGPEERRDTPTRFTARRRAGIVLLSMASVLAIGSITTGSLALSARSDFDATSYQRPAFEAAQRYDDYRWAAGITGGLSIVLGIAGGVLVRP